MVMVMVTMMMLMVDGDDDGCGTQSEWAMMSSQARVFISRTGSSTSQEPRKGAAAIPAPGGQSLPRSFPRLSLQVYQTAGAGTRSTGICWSPANSMSSVHWDTALPPRVPNLARAEDQA
ncbi:uncharacterized protein CIMG_01170 [Coccidioides immitis RS]|uniref:Secreted protein n=4 Tax=Coccidioides immitis TaxID=5501 RepID=J3KIL5_COCIM|nr:uncharacterized protein CIMG_01170 [Coccidioides immitis RS]EAS35816.3 hypothetical protein CIMG_01170 [Coccidioides immitis RS]KMP01103.1 hypothetical protein CIRG_01243 [Coccidioides immitis RMSCC 2394]KMU74315.1 hypothetical protein CISG_04664 [Coccidioides immitis RMSCC 3703]KMU83611.1 hypothetical protein CIHG_01394 [Coccidioides immitis H538.4]